MKEKIYFMIQYMSTGSSSRGALLGGKVLEKSDLFDKEYMEEVLSHRNHILFQIGRGELKDIKSMTLKQFNKYFNKNEIEKLEYLIDREVFRQEIYKTYNKEMQNIELTTVYESGTIIETEKHIMYLYLGKIKELTVYEDGTAINTYSGHWYEWVGARGQISNDVITGIEKYMERIGRQASKWNNKLDCIQKTKKKCIKGKVTSTDIKLEKVQKIAITLEPNTIYRSTRYRQVKYKA